MTTTQPCVSLGTGVLSPDLRVFYQYGMVLGLDDFVQEQTHNLYLDYHHERALHGYGTVYGLHVTTSTPADNPSDVTVTVEPGMAVDQWGREVTVTCAQCARLGAWLAAQEEASPGTIEANLGLSGELVVYVVAAYADCPDDLVPVPGQPCSTSSQLQVPSRLRDAWDIEFRWSPPAMPAWDAIRRLAQLLNSVEVVPGLSEAASSEEDIIQAVLAVPLGDSPSGYPIVVDPSSSPAASYLLPKATADEAFNRIFGVWVTQVRPQLAPDLTAPSPCSDPSVLLSTLTFVPATPFSTSSPVILSYDTPDDAGRPFLLSTELIQELRFGGQAAASAPPAVPVVEEAVTLGATATSDGTPTLSAWFHLGQPVSLPSTISVVDENGQSGKFTTRATPPGSQFSELWALEASEFFTVSDGDQLSAQFPGASVLVGNSATTLATVLAGQGWLNTDSAGDVTAYATVPVPTPPPPASAPFVTISYVTAGDPYLELWFHLQPAGNSEDITVTRPYLEVYLDEFNPPAPLFDSTTQQNTMTNLAPNVWRVPVKLPGKTADYLRLIFDAVATQVQAQISMPSGLVPPQTLDEWINYSGTQYLGQQGQPGSRTIVAFARVAIVASEGNVDG